MVNIIEIMIFSTGAGYLCPLDGESVIEPQKIRQMPCLLLKAQKVIQTALDAGYEPISCLVEKKHVEGQAAPILAQCRDIPVYTAEFDVLTQLTGFGLTRGMLCVMRRKGLPSVEDVCKNARRIAILEDVMNPTNVGAIFRSAAALGMDGILSYISFQQSSLYRRAIRVSMGTVFQIPWTFMNSQMSWPEPAVGRLHEMGFKIAAMALDDNSVSIDDPQLVHEEKLAIVLGTEGDGLAANTIADCDYTVKIPMYHGVDSLNVAAASAVAFWEMRRR